MRLKMVRSTLSSSWDVVLAACDNCCQYSTKCLNFVFWLPKKLRDCFIFVSRTGLPLLFKPPSEGLRVPAVLKCRPECKLLTIFLCAIEGPGSEILNKTTTGLCVCGWLGECLREGTPGGRGGPSCLGWACRRGAQEELQQACTHTYVHTVP